MSRAPAALAAAVLATACAGPAPQGVTLGDGRYAMGTVLEVTLRARDEASGRAALEDLFAEAERLDALLTRFAETSELSRLNRAAGRGPISVDPSLADLLSRSIAYAALTRGAFDVTVGPLVALWTEAARRGKLPSEEELARAQALVGAGSLRVVGATSAEIARPGVSVDLGGIAKGYALDRMLPLLRARGIRDALLNFGQSSTWALGAPDGGGGWRLLARGAGDDLLGVVTLRDQALSISGSLGQFVEIEGRRFGHVLDPRTGEPLTRRRQALVVAPEAALAEALSKALLILGPEEGVALVASRPGCHGLLVDAEGGRHATPGWEALFSPLP